MDIPQKIRLLLPSNSTSDTSNGTSACQCSEMWMFLVAGFKGDGQVFVRSGFVVALHGLHETLCHAVALQVVSDSRPICRAKARVYSRCRQSRYRSAIAPATPAVHYRSVAR